MLLDFLVFFPYLFRSISELPAILRVIIFLCVSLRLAVALQDSSLALNRLLDGTFTRVGARAEPLGAGLALGLRGRRRRRYAAVGGMAARQRQGEG
jgi:hypothetical protein